jgi:heme-degrading monooxygenase HmoA
MVTVGLYYEVVPGKEAAFEEKVEQVMGVLGGNPGHLKSFLYRRVHEPNSYAIISEWSSQAEFTNFVRSEIFRQVTDWGKAEVLQGRPNHKVYGHERDLR